MEELLEKIAELLDVESLDTEKHFKDYDEWDSLAGLSIIALLDSDYHQAMTTKEILSFNTIGEFCEAVLKAKQ